MNYEGKPDCNFEYRTVHVDSIYADGTFDGAGNILANNFTVSLPNPIENIVECKVISASMDQVPALAATSNIAYLVVDELTSQFNSQSGNVTLTQVGTTASGQAINGQRVSSRPSGAAIAKFQLDNTSSDRQTYKGNDYPCITQYIVPIERLSKLSIKVYGEDGASLVPLEPPFFCTLSFTTMKRNLCVRL